MADSAARVRFVDGIGPPLEQIEQDYRELIRKPRDSEGHSRIGVQAASDVLALIAEIRHLDSLLEFADAGENT